MMDSNILNKYNHLQTTEHPELGRFYGTPENPYLYPSASTILKATIHQPGLIDYYKNTTAKAIDKRLTETSAIGTELHDIFEKVIKGEEVEVPKAYSTHVSNFKGWLLKNQVQHIASEFVVVSERYGFAGRVDSLALVNNKVEVLDWKTGNIFGDTWGDQVGGYHLALTEMLGSGVDNLGMRVVQVKRDGGELKDFRYSQIEWMQDSFLLALERFKRVPRFNQLKKIGWPYLLHKVFTRTV